MPDLARFHRRIEEKQNNAGAAPVLIVAIGDSVTQGCMDSETIDSEGVYHSCLKRLLQEEYPRVTFSVINAGVSGDSAPGGLARLERDVLRHAPDLAIVAFGLNDACGGRMKGLDAFKNKLREIAARIRQETEADILFLTPNMMITRRNDAVAECHKHLVDGFLEIQGTGIVEAYAQGIRDVAAELQAPVADVYAEWSTRAANGEDMTAKLSNGLNHPTADMQFATAKLIMKEIKGK